MSSTTCCLYFCNDSAPHLDSGVLHPVVASRKIDFQSEVLAPAGLTLYGWNSAGLWIITYFYKLEETMGEKLKLYGFNNLTKAAEL